MKLKQDRLFRLGLAFRGIDRSEDPVADEMRGGWLAPHLDIAERLRFGRVGDVDKADHTKGAVGIDERHAVGRSGDDLRVGPTDGNNGGEIVQVFKTYSGYFTSPSDIDFAMVIYDGDITVTLDSVDYSDTYGEIKALNSTTAYAWDEFEYGAYIGIDTWPYDSYGINNVFYDVLVDCCGD